MFLHWIFSGGKFAARCLIQFHLTSNIDIAASTRIQMLEELCFTKNDILTLQ